jgi:cell division control protein 6
LTDSYIPDDIIARDRQINEISSNLQPIIDLSSPINMFITGENGVGKTITVNYVLKMLIAGIKAIGQDINIDFIKINCGIRNNDTEICKEILSYYNLDFNPKGYSISSTMQKIWDHINEKARQSNFYTVIFFFDEVDKLNVNKKRSINSEDAQLDLLYQITRAVEYGLIKVSNCKLGVITASNKPHFLETVERSITTAAGFYNLTFPNYKENDLFLILMDRIDAFQPNVISEELIRDIAKDVAERYRGDARRALDTLLYSGKFAFDEGDTVIRLRHVHAAEEKITLLANEKLLSDYSKHDKFLFIALDLCHQYTSDPNTGLIYAVYVWICNVFHEKPTTEGHISRTLSLLVDNGILNKTRGFRGNTRVFSLTESVKNSLHVMYTTDMKTEIDKNIIDLELLISDRKKQKKGKNNKLDDF